MFCTLALLSFPSIQQPAHDNSSLTDWEIKTNSSWRLIEEPAFGTARFLYGGQNRANFTPQVDSEWFELARQSLDSAFALFNIGDSTLVEDEVILLPLAEIGGQNKMAVIFKQFQNGIEVVQGSCSVLFAEDGTLLAIDSTAIPGVRDFSTSPLMDPFAAITVANNQFELDYRKRAEKISQPELVIIRHQPGKTANPRLAWAIELRTLSGGTVPTAKRFYVAADTTMPEVLRVDELIHHQQVSGNVQAWASPGTLPDMASNPETLHPMPEMTVSSSAGNTTTDANGDFSINSSSPVDVTLKFTGTWARVLDDTGAEYSLTETLTPGSPANIQMNPNKKSDDTAEANAFRCLNDFHTWIKKQNAGDTKMDFRATANVMLNSTCNAYYNGSSINFYAAGGGCNNTAYSTVVAHEQGHWANDKYSSGNGADGFGEGNADVYSNFIYDTPITGEYFTTSGGYVRTALNTRQYCGDGNGGCYGQVHADGEVLMGALWKVRARLNTTHGNAAGDAIADMLHSAWMNGYNDGQIHSIIEEHWLALDDTDGNIFNGTPNYDDINGGFLEQGFPGVDLQLIDIVHTPLGDTQNETGPYLFSADISSWIGATITGAEVLYSVNDGPEQSISMTLNSASGQWDAGIPGQISPAKVEYHILAHDSAGNDVTNPRTGDYSFIVGVVTRLYFNDFEGSTDEGWTHGLNSTQDDWQRGTPTGQSGTNQWGVAWQDPSGAFSGDKCWVNDLGQSGWNGSYMPDVDNWLQSATIDCTGAFGVKLRFQRWLSVEQGIYDNARIYVNDNLAWENPSGSHIQETAWAEQEVDISSWADNNPATVIKFTMESDGGLELGGWGIDDFELLTIDPVPGGNNTIVLTGPTMAFAGTSLPYDIKSAPANSPYWFAWSTSLNGSVIGGHSFDLGAPVQIALQGITDAVGVASFNTPTLPPSSSGMTIYLEVAAQDNSAALYDSNPIVLTVL